MTRSAVPGYLAVAALEALVAAVPVTTVPMPGAPAGGRPVGAAPLAAGATAAPLPVPAALVVFVPDEPQAVRPPTATRPALLRMTKRRLIMRRGSRAKLRDARAGAGRLLSRPALRRCRSRLTTPGTRPCRAPTAAPAGSRRWCTSRRS